MAPRSRSGYAFLSLALGFGLAAPVHAGVGRWTEAGLPGGTVLHVVADPGDPEVVWAAGPGLYKSLDEGLGWHRLRNGLPVAATVTDLVRDPAEGALYALAGDGLFGSVDGGASWRPLTPLPGATACSLALVTTVPTSLFAISRVDPQFPDERALYRSRDGGLTWQFRLALSSDGDDAACDGTPRFAADPADPETVYLAAEPFSVTERPYRSGDGGSTWGALTRPRDQGVEVPVATFATAPGAPDRLYALSAGPPARLFRSDTRGDAWTLRGRVGVAGAGGEVADRCSRLTVAADDPDLLLAACDGGLHRSPDAGLTWNRLLAGPATAAGATGDGAALLAGTPGGLLRSADGGATWEPPPKGR